MTDLDNFIQKVNYSALKCRVVHKYRMYFRENRLPY